MRFSLSKEQGKIFSALGCSVHGFRAFGVVFATVKPCLGIGTGHFCALFPTSVVGPRKILPQFLMCVLKCCANYAIIKKICWILAKK